MRLLKKIKSDRKISKKIVVVYHGDCTDGFSAAWAAWKKLKDSAEYIGIDPDEGPSPELLGKEIYMIDVVFKKGLEELIKNNKKVIAIDHHISNQQHVKIVPDRLFDLQHSAAVLSWMYFFPGKEIPKLLKYVEDVDLWNLKLPHQHEIFSAMDLLDFNFENWARMAEDFEKTDKFNEYVEQGKIVLAYQSKQIERLVTNNMEAVEFLGHNTFVVNSPNFSSQIGNLLAIKSKTLGMVWFQKKDGTIHVSLRSIGDTDVPKMAKKFGGGGHRHSAGFSIENHSKLPWKIIK